MDDVVLDWLWRAFPKDFSGALVDVGAGNGVNGSLSRPLLKDGGWRGLLIDPLPIHIKSLQTLYQSNDKVRVVGCAVMPQPGEGLLYPFKEVTTTCRDWAAACEEWWDHVHYSPPLKVVHRTLNEILESEVFPHSFDLLKVDTEGRDFDILKSLEWKVWSPDIVVAEILDMTHPSPEGRDYQVKKMRGLLEPKGYEFQLVSSAGNVVFRRMG